MILTVRHGRVILIFRKGGEMVIQGLQEELHLIITECEGIREEVQPLYMFLRLLIQLQWGISHHALKIIFCFRTRR